MGDPGKKDLKECWSKKLDFSGLMSVEVRKWSLGLDKFFPIFVWEGRRHH